MPTLDLHADSLCDPARMLLGLVVQSCARTLNHRPRFDRRGRSRVELYNEPVTAEQIDEARRARGASRGARARACHAPGSRHNPTVWALLDDADAQLGLLDPKHHLRAIRSA
jgi:hypothetical protein